MSKANTNIAKLLLTGVVGGAIALGGSAIYTHSTGQNTTTNSSTGTTQVSKVSVDVNTDTTKAIKKVSNAVVSVLNYSSSSSSDNNSLDGIFGSDSGSSSASNAPQLSSEGSGVIYKKSGGTAYVVTNYHVIAGNSSLEVKLSDGHKVKATVVGYDEYTDLAVLKMSSSDVKTVATFGNSDDLTVGEPAIAVGSPLGSTFANTATEGIVSAKSRQVTMSQESNNATTNINAIQTDASINPGNSGGALINIEGQVIGITQSKITSADDGTSVEGMGFAIPSNTVVTIINKLEADGKVVRPGLGIEGTDLSTLSNDVIEQLKLPNGVTSGVVIAQVQSGMPIATAGLKEYDVITKFGKFNVGSMADLTTALNSYSIGDTVQITYYRSGKEHTASVKLSKTSSDIKFSNSNQNNTNSDSNDGN
ncbi:S1C family serine protease [Lactococcus nasutitermitis]|uniref:S1C family serine protease n=1 Tax=Lactococcus nasutitermitis TaxID=1652957 RepID=A0ABV9JFQ3_9LACT|nr:trypsin-like peptidase domain-containing protein [Lactococcus nasutitermitis]